VLDGSASAVGQNSAINSYMTRPLRKALMARSSSLMWSCSSSSTRCQSRPPSGPSKNPSTETDSIRMIFRAGAASGMARLYSSVDDRRRIWPRSHPDLAHTLSLLVAHRGELVFERYYRQAAPGDLHHVHSVTKSVMWVVLPALSAA